MTTSWNFWPGSSVWPDTYLTDFNRFEATEAIGGERLIIEDEDQQVEKNVGTDKTTRINNLPHEVYSRLLHMFAPLLVMIYNYLMKKWTIPNVSPEV